MIKRGKARLWNLHTILSSHVPSWFALMQNHILWSNRFNKSTFFFASLPCPRPAQLVCSLRAWTQPPPFFSSFFIAGILVFYSRAIVRGLMFSTRGISTCHAHLLASPGCGGYGEHENFDCLPQSGFKPAMPESTSGSALTP